MVRFYAFKLLTKLLKIAETPVEKANILNEQFTSVFTVEDTNNIPGKGPSPYTQMNNMQELKRALCV